MKKFLFGLVAVLLLSAPMAAQTRTEKPPLIELQFGRVSKGCGGFGICVFKINATVEDVVTLVTAFINPAGVLGFKMSPTFYKDHVKSFPNGYLQIDEDYKIDLETTRKLGVADGYTIKQGKYQVVFDKSTNTYNCTF